MKNILTSTLIILFGIASNAQEVNNISLKEIPAKYITMKYESASLFSKPYILIDYGQITEFTVGKQLKNRAALKENDKEKVFKSELDAINFLAENGFKLIESYQNVTTNVYKEVITQPRKFMFENLNF